MHKSIVLPVIFVKFLKQPFFFYRLNSNTETHLKTLGLRHMPTNMREINTQKFITTPNRDSYVFVCVKDDAPSVLVSDGTSELVFVLNSNNFFFTLYSKFLFDFIRGEIEVELLKNSQHLLPYRSISSLLQNNTVNLL